MKKITLFAVLASAILVTASAFDSKPINLNELYYHDASGNPVPVPDGASGESTKWECLPSTNQCLYDESNQPIPDRKGTFRLIPPSPSN